MPSNAQQDPFIARFRAACEAKGLKVTHQRLEIYRVLAESDDHPDAEIVYQQVRERIPTVSLDTVYRNLKLLAEHGIISFVGISRERVRFDAKRDPHHHFVCIQCGSIRDFESNRIDAYEPPKEAHAFGTPVSVQLEVKGICSRCQKQA